eukprot:766980-Hanusia_phi.AAC.3
MLPEETFTSPKEEDPEQLNQSHADRKMATHSILLVQERHAHLCLMLCMIALMFEEDLLSGHGCTCIQHVIVMRLPWGISHSLLRFCKRSCCSSPILYVTSSSPYNKSRFYLAVHPHKRMSERSKSTRGNRRRQEKKIEERRMSREQPQRKATIMLEGSCGGGEDETISNTRCCLLPAPRPPDASSAPEPDPAGSFPPGPESGRSGAARGNAVFKKMKRSREYGKVEGRRVGRRTV